jgi:Tfp pilus assembly protein PilF
MKTTTALTSLALLVALAAVSATGCQVQLSSHRPSSADSRTLLDRGIKEYNAGKGTEAKATLESVVERTRSRELAETRAVAHFYLAAVAWDFGEKAKTDEHLRECLSLRPNYQPNWTYFAPGLRQRYEALR